MTFTEKCYQMLKKVPSGKVTFYSELAKAAGRPNAGRSAGNIMKNCPSSLNLPCHRVILASGKVGEFLSGKDVKIDLLQAEGIFVKNNKVVNLEKHLFTFD